MVLSNKVLGSTVHELQQQPNVRSPLGYKSSMRALVGQSGHQTVKISRILHYP